MMEIKRLDNGRCRLNPPQGLFESENGEVKMSLNAMLEVWLTLGDLANIEERDDIYYKILDNLEVNDEHFLKLSIKSTSTSTPSRRTVSHICHGRGRGRKLRRLIPMRPTQSTKRKPDAIISRTARPVGSRPE